MQTGPVSVGTKNCYYGTYVVCATKNKQSNDLTPTAPLAIEAAELFVCMLTLQLLKNAEQPLALSTDAGVDN